MVKVFILVVRGTKKSKVFIKDIKQLYVAPQKQTPPVPTFYDIEHKKYEEKRELSCLFSAKNE